MSSVPALAPPALAATPRRHLCDVPFRFGPEAPAPSPARPAASEAEASLDDVLAALARGAVAFETNAGLRLRHANRRPALARAVSRHARHVRAWNELALSGRGADRTLDAWPTRVRLYLEWLDRVVLPSRTEIDVRPGVRVTDRAAFRRAIQERIELGPESASAAGLMSDLKALFEGSLAAREAGETTARVPLARAA